MTDITLYTHPYSRGRIARWMLEEVGANYDVTVLEYGPTMKTPEYLALNPMGKVPALTHNGAVVTEVAAICAYLADCFPQANLAPPPGSPQRASYYRWMFFMAGPFEMASSAKSFNWHIDEKMASIAGCGRIGDAVNALETALQHGPYICGEQFTAADVLVASYIGWEMMQKNLEERPGFKEYVQRANDRPAAARANQLDDALLSQVDLSRFEQAKA